jgi:hypothetical protein
MVWRIGNERTNQRLLSTHGCLDGCGSILVVYSVLCHWVITTFWDDGMNENLKTLHESKNFDEIYNLIETKFSQFESRWNSVLASEEGVELYRNTKLSPNQRDKIYRKMFAELIVKECMDICQELVDDGLSEAETPKWMIKEHFFGVKE